METSTGIESSSVAPTTGPVTAPGRLPWPSLLVLGATVFVVVVAEMLPTAVLPQLARDLGVSPARAGVLVSLWAATVVVASIPLARFAARWDRRAVVAGAMVVLAVSVVGTALADAYPAAVASRLLGAAAAGLVWATVNAHTAAVVDERLLARGVAVVLAGATLGTVLGVPAANLAARTLDWRAGFWAVAVLALAMAVAVPVLVVGDRSAPPTRQRPAGRPGRAAAADRRHEEPARLRGLVVVAGLVGLVMAGHFVAFTFVAVLLEPASGSVPGGVSGLLLLFGLVSAASVVAVGRVPAARTARALVVTSAAVVPAVLAAALLGRGVAVDLAVVVVWAATSAVVPPLGQTLVMRLAGTDLRGIAGAVIPVAFNLGIAVGAALGSATVDVRGHASLPAVGAVVVLVAVAGLVLAAPRVGPASRRPHHVG